MEALISQHPTRVLLLYPTNLHHNRQPNLSKCTPINQMKAPLTPPKLRPPLLTLYWQCIHTSDDDASDISNVLSVKRSCQIQVCQHYLFQHANHTNQQLVDHGANGDLARSDMRVIHKTHRKINIQGIDNDEVTGLDVVTAATLLNTSQEHVIGIFNEYAYIGKGSSIHSSGQLEWFKTNVDEKSVEVGGSYILSLSSSRMVRPMPPPLENHRSGHGHISTCLFTSPDEWDP